MVKRSLFVLLLTVALFSDSEADTWFDKGPKLYEEGKYEEAFKVFDKVTEINPNDSMAWYNKCVMLDKVGKYAQAIIMYDKAVQSKPDYSWAWYNKAKIYLVQNNREDFIKIFLRQLN